MFYFKSKLFFQSAEMLPHTLLATQIWPHRTVLILTSSAETVAKLLKYDIHEPMNINMTVL
jgi:hypothetical protein